MSASVDPSSSPDPSSSGGRWGRRSRSTSGDVPWIPLVFVAILLGGVAWWWFGLRTGENGETPPVEGPAAVAASDSGEVALPEPPPLDLPPLAESDGIVRRVVGVLSRHPRWAEWLVTDELALRFVSAVANVAAGVSPGAQVPFLAPEGDFQVETAGATVTIDPVSYRRYDALTDAFVSFDTDAAVDLYRQLMPLFDEAHRSLGFPEGTFGDAFTAAVGNVVRVDVPEAPPEVQLDVETYLFTDAELEALSPAEKHVLRLGPDNARRVQAKLRELLDGLVASGALRAR